MRVGPTGKAIGIDMTPDVTGETLDDVLFSGSDSSLERFAMNPCRRLDPVNGRPPEFNGNRSCDPWNERQEHPAKQGTQP
jgi:hypothetical protein